MGKEPESQSQSFNEYMEDLFDSGFESQNISDWYSRSTQSPDLFPSPTRSSILNNNNLHRIQIAPQVYVPDIPAGSSTSKSDEEIYKFYSEMDDDEALMECLYRIENIEKSDTENFIIEQDNEDDEAMVTL